VSKRNDDELLVVKKWHLYVVVASVLSFIAGMTVRSLLLGPVPYYVMADVPIGSTSAAPTSAQVGERPTSAAALSPTAEQPSPTAGIVEVSADDDPALGPLDAEVVIVEFSDFQCGYCGRFATETLHQILDTYGDDIRFVFRDFPLTSIHAHAQKAAEAAQCAHEQGKYWEYHDLLFQNQQALGTDSLRRYAEQSVLDTEAFDECLDSGRYTSEVEKDLADGQSYGVTGTPTFFINGHLLVGAKPLSAFQAMIEDELAH
jgi:protein-disulfide isomerase